MSRNPESTYDRLYLDKERSILALASEEAFALWNLRNGQLLHNIDLEYDAVTDMAFSPDGSLLAVAMCDGGVQFWSVADGIPGHLLDVEDAYGYSKSIAFSPDGRHLALGTRECEDVWLWNVADGRLLRMMETHPHAERIYGLAFSPDGALLVGGDFSGNRRVNQTQVWDVETGRPVQSFSKKSWLPVFNANGKLLVSTFIEHDRQARLVEASDPIFLWDVTDRALLRQFNRHKEQVQRLMFSSSERILLSCGADRVACWWDVESGQEIYRLEVGLSTRASGAFSINRHLLATGCKDGSLRLWLVNHRKLRMTFPNFPGGQGQEGIAINSANTHLASWTQGTFIPGSLCVWMQGETRPLQLGDQKWVFSAAFSSKDLLVAAGCHDHTIRLWDIAEKKPDIDNTQDALHILRHHSDIVRSLAFSPDDHLLASGSRDCTICLWDIKQWDSEPLHILQGHKWEVMALAFSPDGTLLASGSEDRSISIWDVPSGQLLCRIEGHTGPVHCLAFSLDGTCLASGSLDGSVRIWNMADGMPQVVHDHAPQAVSERGFALDGTPIESNLLQESVWLWELPASLTVYQVQQPHTQITCLAFTNRNSLLVSGYCDGPTQTWRLETI